MVRGDTLAARTTTQYGHLYNGHKASVVKIESFVPYFNTDRYVIDHHNGDVYLWDRGKQQHGTVGPSRQALPPLSADAVKMLTPNCCQCTLTCLAEQISVPAAHQGNHGTASRASARTHSCNSCHGTPPRSFLGQCIWPNPRSNPPQYLHWSIQHGQSSRWRDLQIEPPGRNCWHLKQTNLELSQGRWNLSPLLCPASQSNVRGALKLYNQLGERLWQLPTAHPPLGWSTSKGCKTLNLAWVPSTQLPKVHPYYCRAM